MIEITDFSSHNYNDLARKNFSVGEGNAFPFVSLSPTHSLMQETKKLLSKVCK